MALSLNKWWLISSPSPQKKLSWVKKSPWKPFLQIKIKKHSRSKSQCNHVSYCIFDTQGPKFKIQPRNMVLKIRKFCSALFFSPVNAFECGSHSLCWFFYFYFQDRFSNQVGSILLIHLNHYSLFQDLIEPSFSGFESLIQFKMPAQILEFEATRNTISS